MVGAAGGQGAGGEGRGGQSKSPGSLLMLYMMMPLMLLLLLTPDLRFYLGLSMDICLGPTIAFDHVYPVLTIMSTSVLMVIATTFLRHKFTDWVSVGKQSYLQKFVQKKFKEAQGNPQKVKKVQELNAEVMKMTGDRMSSQMKTMMFTMVFSLLLFMWLMVFIYTQSSVHIVSAPWAVTNGWSLWDSGALIAALTGGASKGPMPNWILLYMLFSIPTGQVLQASLKYFTFKKRIEKIERGEIRPGEVEETTIFGRPKKKADAASGDGAVARASEVDEGGAAKVEEGEAIEVDEGDFEVDEDWDGTEE